MGSETLTHAELQSARGGATIVNYNHEFFKLAGMAPPIEFTCHFSLVCDLSSAALGVHWRVEVEHGFEHHMQTLSHHVLRDITDHENPGMVQVRGHLRNVLEWAVGLRREKFKEAIDMIAAKDVPYVGISTKRKRAVHS